MNLKTSLQTRRFGPHLCLCRPLHLLKYFIHKYVKAAIHYQSNLIVISCTSDVAATMDGKVVGY